MDPAFARESGTASQGGGGGDSAAAKSGLAYDATLGDAAGVRPMKDRYPSSELRTFAVLGHASEGKTLLAEAMLVCAGRIGRAGSIGGGTTVSDFHPSEHQHQISVHASVLTAEWLGRKLTIVDTPGYADFVSEAIAAVRVADFALVVVGGLHGPGVGTDTVWEYATRAGLPKIVAINALDKANASFDRTLQAIRDHFGRRVFPLTLPLDAGPEFSQVLDVLRNEVVTYRPGSNGRYEEKAAEGDAAERVRELHRELIEYVAESDDSLMERFFAQGILAEDELRAGLHRAVQQQVFVPAFAVSAERNVGVARLMDFIAKYGSSPLDHPDFPGESDPALFVFKTMNEPGVGELSLFRVCCGTLRSGQELFNRGRQATERLGQLYSLNGRERTPVPALEAGDLGAVVKLRATHTGDVLSGPRQVIEVPKVEYPPPTIHGALRLRSRGDEDKLAVGLAMLHEEDPSFRYRVDDEVRQTIVSGQGEIHLQIIVERLARRFGVAVELEEPRIPYRETVRARGESRYRHKKQTGGAGQFAEVWLRVAPGPRGSGIGFTQSLVGNDVDRVFVPSVEKGVRMVCQEGVLAACRIVDVKIDFYGGKMHPVDSKDIAFQVAGYHAFKEAFSAAAPCLLEPIYSVVITTPEDYVGAIMGELASRRGRILGIDADTQFQTIRAEVPQKQLHHYSTQLRAVTSGRGRHTEAFSHYEEVPPDQVERVLAEIRSSREPRVAK